MAEATRAKLNDAKRKYVTIRLNRSKLEPGVWINGYVVDHSDKFLLVEEIDNRIRLDGYNILRKNDVSTLKIPNPRNEFYKSALRLKGERRRKPPRISLENTACVLESIGDSWPLIAIHREVIRPGKCFVGRVVELGQRSFVFETIDLHAKFDGELETLKYSDITRIDFGGGYETALALVAGLTKLSMSSKSKRKK